MSSQNIEIVARSLSAIVQAATGYLCLKPVGWLHKTHRRGLGYCAVVTLTPANRGDLGRLIGRDGETFRALALVAEQYGKHHGVWIELARIDDPLSEERGEPLVFAPNVCWPELRERYRGVVTDIASALFGGCAWVPVIEGTTDARSLATFLVPSCGPRTSECAEALTLLVDAIGRAFGRVVTAEIELTEPDVAQPTSAAGRHVGEVGR